MTCTIEQQHMINLGERELGPFTFDELKALRARIDVVLNAPLEDKASERIICVVCECFHIDRATLLGESKKRHIVWPRHVAMYLMRKRTPRSLNEIASDFHKKVHQAIMHAINAVENRCATDAGSREQVNAIEAML